MKKTKILLVGTLLLGVPSVALSLSTQQENATVVGAVEKTMQFGTNGIKIDSKNVTATFDNKNWSFSTNINTESFTQNPEYSQIGSSKKPAKSFTIKSDNYGSNLILTNFYIKFGGFGGTTGRIKCSYEGNDIGSLSLNDTNDVKLNKDNLEILSTGATSGFEISVTNISKGFKLYSLSYSFMENNPDAKKYTVTYDATGGSCEKENDIYVEGNVGLTLPTAKKDGYKLSGWFDKNGNKIESPFTPTEDITLYAKWEESLLSTYTKVTSNINDWTGKYLIVYENDKVCFNGSLEKLDNASNTKSVLVKDNQIIGDYENYQFTFEKKDTGYSIKSYSNIYIGNTDNSNGLDESLENKFFNYISINERGIVSIKSSGGTLLKYNTTNGQDRFRFYKSGQQDISLYKLEEKPTIDEKTLTSYTSTLSIDNSKAIRFIGSVKETEFNNISKIGFNFTLTLDNDKGNPISKEYSSDVTKLYKTINDSNIGTFDKTEAVYEKDGFLNFSLILKNLPEGLMATISYYSYAVINGKTYNSSTIEVLIVDNMIEF